MGTVGLFGKMPAHGDFVRRGLASAVVSAWDDWLSGLMTALRDELGEPDWLDAFLTGPIWHFALGAGVAGGPAAGVMIPSVDRVGRYFPLVLMRTGLPPAGTPALARSVAVSLAPLETAVLSALADETIDADALLALATADPDPDPARAGVHDDDRSDPPLWRRAGAGAGAGVHVPLRPSSQAERVAALTWLAEDAAGLLPAGAPSPDAPPDGRAFWWTEGARLVAPCLLQVHGWPRARAAVAMLDGDWAGRGWTGVVETGPARAPVRPGDDAG